MSRKTLNIALVALLGVVIYYMVIHHESLFGSEGLLTQTQVDSLLTAEGSARATDSTRPARTYRHPRRDDRPLDDGIVNTAHETFTFDPNTADTTALLRLGFPRWMIRNMLRYRAAGGRYQRPEDVKAIYGMTPEIYERIEPYITIDSKFKAYNQSVVARERQEAREREQAGDSLGTTVYQPKLKAGERIELNAATDSMLRLVPGIGEHRARAILYRRDRLGGFVSIEQIREIDDIPDSCMRYLYVNTAGVRRINLNTATLSAMKQHPYIGGRKAAAIYNYRRMYGRIHSLDDLRLHPDLNPDSLQQLLPYVTLD